MEGKDNVFYCIIQNVMTIHFITYLMIALTSKPTIRIFSMRKYSSNPRTVETKSIHILVILRNFCHEVCSDLKTPHTSSNPAKKLTLSHRYSKTKTNYYFYIK